MTTSQRVLKFQKFPREIYIIMERDPEGNEYLVFDTDIQHVRDCDDDRVAIYELKMVRRKN